MKTKKRITKKYLLINNYTGKAVQINDLVFNFPFLISLALIFFIGVLAGLILKL